ncbi:hypothetical protein CQ059_21230 [Brucella pseudogrignonensis]|nr:hypothetical protein CQ059_21230 [Brucella pseudogrignonensis]PRA37209.1 hypothetical protein CQ063_21300 [Brucella pseudogrignonensis]PRA62858.1 hypothetical protein CQ055_20410 [Brucella pseudogrignonensis]
MQAVSSSGGGCATNSQPLPINPLSIIPWGPMGWQGPRDQIDLGLIRDQSHLLAGLIAGGWQFIAFGKFKQSLRINWSFLWFWEF